MAISGDEFRGVESAKPEAVFEGNAEAEVDQSMEGVAVDDLGDDSIVGEKVGCFYRIGVRALHLTFFIEGPQKQRNRRLFITCSNLESTYGLTDCYRRNTSHSLAHFPQA